MCCQHLTKTVNVSVVFLMITVLLTGCWDRLEIEQRTTVLGIAIDQATEEEAAQESSTTHVQGSFQAPDHKFIKLTLTVAVPGRLALGPGGPESGGGEGQEGKPVWVLESIGHSIDDALNNLEQQLEHELFLGHVRIIVVSEEFAKQGVKEFSDYLRRNSEIRRTTWMAVGKGKASQYLHFTPEIERIPTLYLVKTFDEAVQSGKLPEAYLGLFWTHLSSKGQDGYLPYVKLIENKIVEISGLAYFDKDLMMGKTVPLEIGYFMSIMNVGKAGYKALIPLDGSTVIAEATSRNSRIYSEIRHGKPHFTIKEVIELNITEKNGPLWTMNSSRELRKLQQEAQLLAKKGHEKLIKMMQQDGADIFGFGEIVRAKHARYWNEHIKTKEKWKEIFPDVTFENDVTFYIRRVGMKAR